MKTKFLLSALMVSSLFVGCNDSEDLDTQKPTISITSPTNDENILPNGTINFNAQISDNVGLASYKIEVHSAEDGHSHGRQQTTDFTYDFESNTSGVAQNITHQITVPADVTPEHYHVGIFVIDKAGNQSEQFVEVFLGLE